MDFRESKCKGFFIAHWLSIYRILMVAGGIIGGVLFYPKLIHMIYQYLTEHGFDQPSFIADVNNLFSFIINALTIIMFLSMCIPLIFSKQLLKSKIIAHRGDCYFIMLACIGYMIAGLYFYIVPLNQVSYTWWLFYVGMVLCFRLLMRGLCYRWDKRKYIARLKWLK
ncbi:hypothetical protein [Listeria seeligeri]|uniref:hypothetical protein n=1 Tax=Listeria seeligeri TaxID=1640 RepID=UPI0031CC50CB